MMITQRLNFLQNSDSRAIRGSPTARLKLPGLLGSPPAALLAPPAAGDGAGGGGDTDTQGDGGGWSVAPDGTLLPAADLVPGSTAPSLHVQSQFAQVGIVVILLRPSCP